jgi:XTP/dITP diphosphohydrolase
VLDGAPGIYSARWAGPTKDFRIAMTRIHDELRHKGLSTSKAKFVCALCVALPSGQSRVFEGEVHGTLTFPPRGDHGFGYDPIFIADGMEQTFAEIDPARKHAMSHRARAFEKLLHSGIFTESL